MQQGEGGKCGCVCHKMTGIFIALFGLNFLLKSVGVYGDNISNIVWPVLIILIGLKNSFGKGKCKCCSDS